jgi:hypothetical protein
MSTDFIKNIEFIETKDSNAEYHSKKEYIGASGLKRIKQSPLHFKEEEVKLTEALKFGTNFHEYILEPEDSAYNQYFLNPKEFEDKYFLFDETDILGILKSEGSQKPRATNKYKDWKAEQEEIAKGRIWLELSVMKRIEAMNNRLMSHKYVKSLLSNGEAEKSIYTEIEIFTGQKIKVKIRPDYKKDNKRIIVDLKSTVDASIDEFTKRSANLNYHIQAALYSDIIEAVEGKKMAWSFFFIAQEKVSPYAFNIFEASPQFIAQGRYEYEALLMLWQWCVENNKWPGYQCFTENRFGINMLNLPHWAIKEINWFDHKY